MSSTLSFWLSEFVSRKRLTNKYQYRDSSMNPGDLASQSVRLKEEQLRREEEKLREIETKVQREINEKRQELLARESQLKEIEARMHREQPSSHTIAEQDADEA